MTLEELRQLIAAVIEDQRSIMDEALKSKRALSPEEEKKLEELEQEEARLSKMEERLEKLEEKKAKAEGETSRSPGVVVTREEGENEKGEFRPFKSIGEQLQAVCAAERGTASARAAQSLQEINKRAAAGLSEGVGADGGYLVQTDFSSEMLRAAFETGILASRVRRFPIGPDKNGLIINGVNESSRVTGSRWGGVQTYWENEADEATASKPSFRKIEFRLQKLIGLCYATDELLADSPALGSVISQAFAEEFGFVLDEVILRGNGAGKPLGILNSPSLVTVSKEAGPQTADTVVANNVIKMRSRMWARSRQNGVWLINQDIEPQLQTMTVTGSGSAVAVWMPANGLTGQPNDTLFGRPVIPIEQCSTLGDLGDILFVDLSEYGFIQRGGLDAASSIHVKFTSDQTAFRFIMRVDGKPLWHSALTPAYGSLALSPFVALEAR